MQERAADQIESIHAMMSTGHRSVLMERHSLWLWGITAAGLILTVRHLFTPERFSIPWQRTTAANFFIAFVLIVIAVWDFRMTRQARESRDETLSFIQLQLTKVWWLILGLIVLVNIGVNVFGGGMLFYPILLSLTGLAFYIQGLFSKQLLSWAGFIMILLGLGSAALRLPLPTLEWLAIVVFGLGLPSLGLFIHRTQNTQHRLLQPVFFMAWVGLILLTAAMINHWNMQSDDTDLPLVMLNDYQQQKLIPSTAQIIRLPAGTIVPVEVNIKGDVLKGINLATVPLQLSEDFDMVVEGGKPDGRFRKTDGSWKQHRFHYRLRDFKLTSEVLSETGPRVKLQFYVSTEGN